MENSELSMSIQQTKLQGNMNYKSNSFYLLSFRINRLALCENTGHGDAIGFIINADLIASSTTFDSLSLQGFGRIFGTFIIELDAIVFISGSYQVFLKFRPVVFGLGLVPTLSRMEFSISPI